MSITRIFRQLPELTDGSHKNEGTAILVDPFLRGSKDPDKLDAEALFTRHWKIIRRALNAHQKQGIAIFAFDAGKDALAQAWIAASLDRTRAAIAGRHSMCGVALPSKHTAVSLRHLAILVRATSHTAVRVRVIDLHTQSGFTDEAGRVLQSITADGSVFLRVGDTVLAIIATEDGDEPVADAATQYKMIPARVFVDELEGTNGAQRRFASFAHFEVPKGQDARSSTIVRSRLGPVAAAGELCKTEETPLGTLVVRGGGGGVRRPVGATVLERGLLVGRYTRCEVGSASNEEGRLSRVHLLLIKDGPDILAIDTASSNGTFLNKRALLLHKLTDGDTLDLGGEMELSWHRES